MKATKLKKLTKKNSALTTGTLIAMAFGSSAYAQTLPASSPSSPSDPVVDALIQKGILTQGEAEKVEAEIAARQANFKASLETNVVNDVPVSRFKMADSIKSMQLYGDLRLRYEYRGADNVPGAASDTFYRERMRYALRVGIRGDLFDDWSYGIRLETANNPRSPWDTFGNNTTSGAATPSDKNSSGIYLGQVFLNWHPTGWYEMTAGRMPMPLYTTPMVWDSDINPEGAFEKFKYTIDNVDLFADFGQFDYQDPSSASEIPSSDTFLLAWQAGANVRIGKDMSVKDCTHGLYIYRQGHRQRTEFDLLWGKALTARIPVCPEGSMCRLTTKKASMICSFWKYQPNLISKSGTRRWEHCRRGCLVILPTTLTVMIGHAPPTMPIPERFPA